MTERNLTNEPGRPRTPEEIQAEIARTRSVVHEDIKAIGDKFSAEQLKENAKGVLSDAKQEGATMVREAKDAAVGSLRDARDNAVESASETLHELGDRARHAGHVTADYARDYARQAGDYARQAGGYARRAGGATGSFVAENAVPLSLIGIGVGLLALSVRRSASQQQFVDDYDYGYEDDYLALEGDREFEYETSQRSGRGRRALGNARTRAESLAHDARDRIGGAADSARERVGQVADSARERVGHVADSARERVQGVAQSARETAGNVADSAREIAEGARERVGQLAERASESVSAARTRVSDTASQIGTQATELSREARERLYRAQLRTRDFADENPLAVGVVAIAAGVGVGLLLPATQPENRLMGETRDRLLGDARGLIDEARHAGEIVGQKARETAHELRNTANDARISH